MRITDDRIDGLEVLRRLRGARRTQLLSVVVVTSSLPEVDILVSHQEGANALARRPASVAKFSDAVKTSGMLWPRINESTSDAL